ncbi:MAG: flavodoxin domain-containing protein [Actinomycetia bacterium]|nr:flavodoxin domain-containing protein [Actinomycetes bacterium]
MSRVLVIFDTKFGATREIAEAIGSALCGVGLPADVEAVSADPDITKYSAVVLGAPVFCGKVEQPLCDWVHANRDALAELPTAVFVVGASARDDTPETRAALDSAMEQALCDVPNLGAGLPRGRFAGRIDANKLPAPTRFMMRMAKLPVGDWVDLDRVHAWAIGIASRLV